MVQSTTTSYFSSNGSKGTSGLLTARLMVVVTMRSGTLEMSMIGLVVFVYLLDIKKTNGD